MNTQGPLRKIVGFRSSFGQKARQVELECGHVISCEWNQEQKKRCWKCKREANAACEPAAGKVRED